MKAPPAKHSRNILTTTPCSLIASTAAAANCTRTSPTSSTFSMATHAVLTGGSLVEQKTTGPGEIRGKSVEGGSRQELRAGDVVHIPAGMPHQMLVSDGESITYFVVKVEESR